MSSKRSTNNSVASLEDQSAVLSALSTRGGLQAEASSATSSDSSKSSRKKTSRSKTARSQSETGNEVPGTSAPGRDVIGAGKAPAAVGKESSAATGSAGQAGTHDLVPDGPQGPDGPGFGAMPAAAAAMASQPWMFPYGFQPSGNFVPNFNFGEVQQPCWDSDDAESVHLGQRQTRDHELSEDEGSSGTEDVGGAESLPPAQSSAVDVSKIQGTGKVGDLLREQLTQVKEADKVGPQLEGGVALLLDKYLTEAQMVADMEKIAKQYPRIVNVEKMRVPRLDSEVYQVVDQRVRNLDQSFQAIQKALLGALAAVAPVLGLAFRRGAEDAELENLGKNLVDGLALISHAHNGMSARQREILRPHLAPVYAKALTKGHDTSPEWLYGGDLLTTTKRCEAARRIGDKILKKRPQQQQQQKQNNQQKRFKNQKQQQQGMLRGFNPYQQVRFPAPQMFAQAQPYYYPNQQTGGYHKFQGNPRPQQQRQQGFQKKGGYQK